MIKIFFHSISLSLWYLLNHLINAIILFLEYKAEINIADYKETSSEIKLNAVEASVEDVSPVFEKEAATFSASIKGPSKPSSVVLVHQGEMSPCLARFPTFLAFLASFVSYYVIAVFQSNFPDSLHLINNCFK